MHADITVHAMVAALVAAFVTVAGSDAHLTSACAS
jgi:hypothetical protein